MKEEDTQQLKDMLGLEVVGKNLCLTNQESAYALIKRMLEAEAKLKKITDLPPTLIGRWHHGNGCIVQGTVRIAMSDFDTQPSAAFLKEYWDWVCGTMNVVIDIHREHIDKRKNENELT